MKLTIFSTIVSIYCLGALFYVTRTSVNKNNLGYLAYIQEDKIHTMQVYEDGSFIIEFKDGTHDVGCLPTGLCND